MPLTWTAAGPLQLTAIVRPKYLVLAVIYAPPGPAKSSVTYEGSNSAGVTVSASQSFKINNSFSSDGKVTGFGNGMGNGSEFQYSRSGTDNQSLEIKRTATNSIEVDGPSASDVVHNEDRIYLALKPTINMVGCASSVNWLLTESAKSHVQEVSVGELNGTDPIPDGTLRELKSAGITQDEYKGILARDPLANKSSSFDPSSLDPKRFVALYPPYAYAPPGSTGGSTTLRGYTLEVSSLATISTSVEDGYQTQFYSSGEIGIESYGGIALKDTHLWEWVSKSSHSIAEGNSQSASFKLASPKVGYKGSTVMQVYFDTIYKTFVFALVPPVEGQAAIENISGTTTFKEQQGFFYTVSPN